MHTTGDVLPDLPLRRSGWDPSLDGLPASIPEALHARHHQPDDDFVIGPDFRLTFGEADAQSFSFAGRLMAAGVGKGTRLASLYANSPKWVITWLAAARIGALTVPLSTFAPGAELARALRHADVHALLTASRFGRDDLLVRLEEGLGGLRDSGPELQLTDAPFLRWAHVDGGAAPWSRDLRPSLGSDLVLRAQSEVHPADSLVLMSTSGATAAPKAVIHSHGSLVRHAALLAQRRGLTTRDRIYSPMPFFWAGGLTVVLLTALTSGAAVVTQERFDPGEALELAERERVTQISCWPNAARAMAEHPSFPQRDLSAVTGGTLIEALPIEHRPAARDLVSTPLGMTETGGPHTGPDDGYAPLPPEQRGTFGRTLPGMEHRIVDVETGVELAGDDEGEILVRGLFLMDALHKRERHETFTPDGWYATGDLGWFGADGLLRFTGRRTAMIKTAGANVSPAEVEGVLGAIPGIRAAYVFGVPAGDRGEDVAAVVVRDLQASLDVDELITNARRALATYKVPRHVRFVDEAEVPMLPTGKVDLVALRSLVGETG